MTILPVEAARLIPAVDVAVSLADEGVPVRAIARSVKIPGEDLYDILHNAIETGKLISLPKDDWPPGARRSDRHQAEGTVLSRDFDTLSLACCAHFKLTRMQAAVFLTILRRPPEISKSQIHATIEEARANHGNEPTDVKIVDVVICHIRKKLAAVDPEIKIETIWGKGYCLPPMARRLALVHIAAHLHPSEAVHDVAHS